MPRIGDGSAAPGLSYSSSGPAKGASGCAPASRRETTRRPRPLSPAAAVQLINRERAVVIDVCDPAEYTAEHVGGAKNIPLAELEAKLPTTVKNKATPLVLVCASGMRAGRAVAVARKLGYDKADALSGGLKAWREANLPIEKA